MASTDRRSARDLIAELGEEGFRFQFFQAVRLLALASPNDSGSPIPPGVRFGTPISLGFPASEILDAHPRNEPEALQPAQEESHVEKADDAKADRLAMQVTVGFMGLTGPSGVLPTCYTESLVERRNVFRDTSAHGFLDMFSHRAISLFYEAWRKHRFHLDYEAGERGKFSRYVLDLVGVGLTSLQSRLQREGGIPDMCLNHYAGLLAQKPVSATSLAALLRGYFKVEAEIEQFVGQWIAVPLDEQSRLGMQSCALGESAFAGERIWDRQNKMCIRLGPLNAKQFADFLPGRPGARAVAELVQFCVGQTLACDLNLILHKDSVPTAQLDPLQPGRLQLGHNAWLQRSPSPNHCGDACFTLLS